MGTPYEKGSPAGSGAPPSIQARRYVGDCARLLDTVIPPLMTALFDKVDDALYDLADKSTSNDLHTVYFDAMRIIRKQRNSIQLNFLQLVRQGADQVAAGFLKCDPGSSPDPNSQDFGLVQDAELEEILAIDNLVSKADSRYRGDLMEMNHYLGGLLDRDSLDGRCNPFGPYAICEAFRGALDTAQQLEPPIRLVLYKLFDKNVTDRLGEYYTGCVKLALAGGHRSGAGFAHLLHRGTGAAAPAGGTSAATAPEPAPVPDPELPQTLSLPFETMQELLGRQRPPDSGGRGRAGRVTLQTSELLAVLSNLDAVAVGQEALTPGALRASLAAILGSRSDEARGLAPKDEDTLDLVFMFFEHLLQGNALPDPIKVLIGRMQIPVAKLALLDKGFFSEQGHPARQLLNHIGEAAVGWSDDDRGPDSLYGMIERVVESLILDYDGDPGLFARLDRYFVAFIAREHNRARATEAQSIAQVATRMPDTEYRAVAAALDACMARYPQVPPAVEGILREGWQPAMLVAYRSERPDSAAWQAGLELADLLLWSVQPKTDAEQRRQLLRRIPEILRSLRSQLSGGGVDQRQLARWFKELQTLHLGVLQGEASGPASPAPAKVPAAARIPEAVVTPSLPLGSWVELRKDDGGRLRLKVAWVSPDGADYVLVDRHGRRGPDLTREELSVQLEEGRAALLGDRAEPIADRALRSVLRRLAH